MNRMFTALALTLLASAPLAAQIDPDLLAGLKARAIGPATMSGRVAAVEAVASNPDIIYVGAATGGVWKSVDAGLTWTPLFDDQPVAAIGAIAVHPENPDLVWVGTGESNVRNSASVGNGVYRSLDGGLTWQHLGLEATERISRIIPHPRDPDTAWVAAMGRAWGENTERGVYKTTDGGTSWTRVLHIDERTGAADLTIDPSNPNKLFAAMWDYRRWPWFFRSGGPGSGLHVTHDGGASWKRLTEQDGLPKGILGRIGVAVSHSDPRIVYALVEAEQSALVRSEDGGRTWKAVNTEPDVNSRPFYYADIRVDPANPNRVYRLASIVTVSEDAGKTFRTLIPWNKIHPDHHALWISPNDPELMIDGNDGGIAISRDRGRTWRYVENLPLAQYYHVNVDMETPYNIYGGLQDNGSWRGPSQVWENGQIRNHHWQEVGFGDGFATLAIDSAGTTGYSMSQEGNLMRWSLRTGERKDIRPAAPAGMPLRFNWNAAIAIDPFDPDTVYYGSQFVHKSTNRGDAWQVISPDLTTNNPDWQKQSKTGGLTYDVTGAENFTTILTIAPSAVERGVIWAGTDDGRIHVTRDGGATWASVENNVNGVPKNTWVPHIEPSKFDAATAFVVFDDHRRSNWTTYVYKTTDYGRTWTSLVAAASRRRSGGRGNADTTAGRRDASPTGYALVIEQDPVDSNLLFLGTEFGLWVSVDGGRQWLPFRHGFPTVSAMAMTIHPREHDLVVGTHGRAAYVIDDIRPLRGLTGETLAQPVHLFDIPDAIQHRVAQTGGERFAGDTEFRGENRPYGALLTFVLNADDLPHPIEEKERERKERELAEARQPLSITETGVPQEEETLPKSPEPPPSQTGTAEPPATVGAAEGRAAGGRPPAAPVGGDAKTEKKQAEIIVKDATGKTIRTFKTPAVRGINRAFWNLRRDAFKQPPREREPWQSEPSGPEIMPGTYSITVRYGGQEATRTVEVLPDPRIPYREAERVEHWRTTLAAGALQDRTVDGIKRIVQTKKDLDVIAARLRAADEDTKAAGGETSPNPLIAKTNEIRKKLETVERMFWVPPKTKGIVDDSNVAWSRVSRINYSLASSWDAPTAAQRAYFAEAESTLREAEAALDRFLTEDLPPYREAVRDEVKLLP